MTLIHILLLAYFLLGGAYWLAMIRSMWLMIARTPVLADAAVPAPAAWPRVSVVVPACDEEADIEPAARTLLSQDYPDLELVLVDDRSTDRTGEIIDRLAAGDSRVKAVHITHLPDGWLGKVNALNEGLRHAGGAWVLFTDADIHFDPTTLRKAVAYAMDRELDHLAAIPHMRPSGLLIDGMIASFLRQLVLALRLWKVNDPAADVSMGVGAFNMVRREAFDRTPGFEWMRLEVGDDVGLGLLMRRHGRTGGFVNAVGLIGLNWYRSIGQAARGVEKAFATAGNCSFVRMALLAIFVLAMELSLFVAMIPWAPMGWLSLPGIPWAFAPGEGGMSPAILGLMLLHAACWLAPFAAWLLFAAYVFVSWRNSRWSGTRFAGAFLAPVSAAIMAVLTIRAGYLGWRRGGMVWRGTLYPSKLMRNAMKVKFP